MNVIIKHLVSKYGDNLITSSRLVNYMDDESAFSSIDTRVYKRLLHSIIADGYSKKLLSIGKWDNEAKMLAKEYAKKYAYSDEYVLYVFNCFAFGLNWTSEVITPSNSTSSQSINSQRQEDKEERFKEINTNSSANDLIIINRLKRELAESKKKAQEALKRESVALKQASESQNNAAKSDAKCKELEKKLSDKTSKIDIKKDRHYEYELDEKIQRIALLIGIFIWLCFAISTIFFFSEGFCQTFWSVIVSGVCGGLCFLLFGVFVRLYDMFTEGLHISVKILFVVITIILELVLLGYALKIIL